MPEITVLFDARMGRRPSGIGHYIDRLARAAGDHDPRVLRPIVTKRHLRQFAAYGLDPVVRDQGILKGLPEADVVHGPNFHAPLLDGMKSVATVHDMAFLEYPEVYPPGMPEKLDGLIRRAIPHTERFLCDSNDTFEGFVKHYGVDVARCDVATLGVEPDRFTTPIPARTARWLRARYRLPRRYVLHVGAMVQRKDLVTLLDAFRIARQSDPDLHLVLAGHKTRRWASDWPRVKAWLRRNRGDARRVHVLRYVPSRHLPFVYREAAVVALTSLTEGFGLTVLEGLAAGKPVVASRAGAIPEIAGDAVYYGEVRQPETFADALRAALSDEDGERKRELAQQAVAAHTWKHTWEITLQCYERARRA